MSFKNAVEHLVKKGFRLENDPQVENLVGRLDEFAIKSPKFKSFDELTPADKNLLKTAYYKLVDSAPAGMSPYQAKKAFWDSMREGFKPGVDGDAAYKQFRKELRTQFGENAADAARVENGVAPHNRVAERAGVPKPEKKPSAEVSQATSQAAELAARADKTIRESVMSMRTVSQSDGKMNKAGFFEDLSEALHNRGLLKANVSDIGPNRKPLTSPKAVFEALENKQAVTESELGKLSTYFGRHHNDAAIQPVAHAPAQPAILGAGNTNRTVAALESVARNAREWIKEGPNNHPTVIQRYEWSTGRDAGFLVRQGANLVERPARTLAAYGTAGLVSYAVGTTALTAMDPQNPSYWGIHAMELFTKDHNPNIPDYSEYLYSRYNSTPGMVEADIKKYYGIDAKTEVNKDGKTVYSQEVFDAIARGPTGPHALNTYVPAALLMVVSQKNFGRAVGSVDEFRSLQEANYTSTARVAEPVNLSGGWSGPSEGETAITVNGKDIATNIDRLYESGDITGNEVERLRSAWKEATGAHAKGGKELTAENVASPAELSRFRKAAVEIASDASVGRTKAEANATAQLLLNPSMSR